MNITGYFGLDDKSANANTYGGAFYGYGASNSIIGDTSANKGDSNSTRMYMDASREWTGATSESGAHSHTFSIASQGGGKSHTHTMTINTHNHNIANSLPPYLKYAFFVKIPD